MITTSDFMIGDKVVFGRKRGQQTRGTVVKVNAKRLKVRQDQNRGSSRYYPIGTEWSVPPALCSLIERPGSETTEPMPPVSSPAPRKRATSGRANRAADAAATRRSRRAATPEELFMRGMARAERELERNTEPPKQTRAVRRALRREARAAAEAAAK